MQKDPGQTGGKDRKAVPVAGGIEPRNEDFENAWDLPLDSSYSESIDPAGDNDYFKLDLSGQSGSTDVHIYTTGDTDTTGTLFDDSDPPEQLDQNDDSFRTTNFSLLMSLEPGIYYVVVGGYNNISTGDYTIHAETATALSLGSSVDASIDTAGEIDYFKLDLSDTTDVSVFTVSDNLKLDMEATPFRFWRRQPNRDALGDIQWVFYLGYGSLSTGSYLFAVWSPDGETGDYSLRAAAVPDHGSTTDDATTLSLDAPTSGKLISSSDAEYFKLELAEDKDLVIMAVADVDAVMLDSGSTEIPVNIETDDDEGFKKIIDDFASGTYYLKITAPNASIFTPVYYALYAYLDTAYGDWFDGCEVATNDLGISTINDSLYACQWHLNSDDSSDMDINVESVWDDIITGEGINVVVVDETIDYSHADLSANINSSLNHDYGDGGNAYRPAEHHGTNVAGVIAARDNTIGVRGVAPRATVYGYNLLGEGSTLYSDRNAADAMSRNMEETAVSNNSWVIGRGYNFNRAPEMWELAIYSGLTQGYDGKGVFYVFAGGNAHEEGDNSNFGEISNYYGVTAACAVGDDGARAPYSEHGANLWVCAPSTGGDRGIVTTENSDRYTNTFGGTSSATPKVSGVAALLRHANPDLTWRDLKLILAASARQNDASNAGWEEGARKYGSASASDVYHFNHEYGFGVVDAAAAVALAQDWRNLPEFKNASSTSGTLDTMIPDNTASGITHSLTLDTEIDFIEFVEVEVTIEHTHWRDLQIELVSPDGIVSTLAVAQASPPTSPDTFRFGSAKHLGEDPNGQWELRVSDQVAVDSGTLESWSITVYGHGFSVRAVSTGLTTATATVWLPNPDAESLTVYLRHSNDDGTTWSTPVAQITRGTLVDFDLTGLAPNAEYDLQASFDGTFADATEVSATFVNRPAHQDLDTLAAADGIWSDGTTIWVADWVDDKLYAYILATGERDAGKDIDTLNAAGNDEPRGIWSDGTTMWVVDESATYLLAYTLADGSRDSGKDIATLVTAGNHNPYGLWSDGTTMWVVDESATYLLAYTLADGSRDSGKDIATLVTAGNHNPYGLWSDGTTIWVSDVFDAKLYAYVLATGAPDSAKDFDTLAAAGNDDPTGIWSDGATMWVADIDDSKIYAYKMSDKARDSGRDFDTLAAAGNTHAGGVWSDGTTVWVADWGDGKLYAYNMPLYEALTGVGAASTGPTTAMATVELPNPDSVSLDVYLRYSDDGTTWSTPATATTTGTSVEFSLSGLAPNAEYDLQASFDSTFADATEVGAVFVNRPAQRDLDTLAGAGNNGPYSLWSDGTTMWVSDWEDDKLYAYAVDTGTRNAARDFNTLSAGGNDDPFGLWSDGTTMWVSDWEDDKLYAYAVDTGTRNAARDFNTLSAGGNDDPFGLWSDGTTMWVADYVDDKLYAYVLATGARDSDKDFDTLAAAGNDEPRGIWSDGATMWVADWRDAKLYAYVLATGARDADKDFDTLAAAGNNAPGGIWSDGSTMWVADYVDAKLYAYKMSDKARDSRWDVDTLAAAENTSAAGLWSDGTTMWVADWVDDKLYAYYLLRDERVAEVSAASTGRETATATVELHNPLSESLTVHLRYSDDDGATWSTPAMQTTTGASVDIGLSGLAPNAEYDLQASFDSTFGDGAEVSADFFNRPAQRDIDTLAAAGNYEPRGIWSDGTTIWVSDNIDDKLYAYVLASGVRDSDKDFDTLDAAGNNRPEGLWSDGFTMWVADVGDGKLYAYTLANGARDSGKDFDLAAGNDNPGGIWSDGETMWVADEYDDKIYAYVLATGARDAGRDIVLVSNEPSTPGGIWSDGSTMWVMGVHNDLNNLLYAYAMADGERDSSKDIGRMFVTSAPLGVGPYHLGSDGETMWVADVVDLRNYAYILYAYYLPLYEALTAVSAASTGRETATATVALLNPDSVSLDVYLRYSGDDGTSWSTPEIGTTAGTSVEFSLSGLAPNEEYDLQASFDSTFGDGTEVSAVFLNRPAHQDLDTLAAAGNNDPIRLWSDGTTMWVADWEDDKIYAYAVDTGTRNAARDFNTLSAAGNNDPLGLWSDGTTMWVADYVDAKLYAYVLATGARDSAKDFDTLDGAGNDEPTGIWSDGTTMWVADYLDNKLYAYLLATGEQDAAKDFGLNTGNDEPYGIWSDGFTMWVADDSSEKLYAYRLATGARDSGKDFDTLAAAGDNDPTGIWSDGMTMWVADYIDDKLYAYYLPLYEALTGVGAASTGPTTATATVELQNPDSVSLDVYLRYSGDDGTTWSTPATATTTGTSVEFSLSGLAPNAEYDLQASFDGTFADGTETEAIFVNRPAHQDLDTLAAADGIWSDGTTMWVADWVNDKLYAYTLATGARDAGKDIDTLYAAGNDEPRGIWSDGTTMWVVDESATYLLAYTLADGSRDSGKDIATLAAAGNHNPYGLWSDGTTIWVSDVFDAKLYAYVLATGERDADEDFDTLAAAGNNAPSGIWSDGATMWVADQDERKLFAYTLDGYLSTRPPEPSGDVNSLIAAGNTHAGGVWSDGTTVWVADWGDGKLYAYYQRESKNSNLSALSVDGVGTAGFDSYTSSYQFGVASSLARVTVEGVAQERDATVAYSGVDADGGTDGHQVDLVEGRNVVTVTVTAEDGGSRAVYTVSVNRGSDAPYGWRAEDDLDTLRTAGNNEPYGIWSDGETIWAADWEDSVLYAYSLATGAGDADRDIHLAVGNDSLTDIWSDGTTMWVADSGNDKLYAYVLATGVRDSAKDVDLAADNTSCLGLWSDGTTIWVADFVDAKLYAYTLADGARDSAKDFDTLSAAGNAYPYGLWSDGATMWVADSDDSKLYAYKMSDKARDSGRDFDTLAGAGNTSPHGIWSDGATMWVADSGDDKLYAYNMPANNAPEFSDGASTTRSVAENTAASSNVGAAVTATDADGDTLTYTLGGTDAASFDITSTSGQILTSAALNYEQKSSYSVTVSVADGEGGTDTIAVTINVTDESEPPDAPGAPTVAATSGATDSLDVSWSAPDTTGRPAISDYDVQYRKSGDTAWTDHAHTGTATTATITGLEASTSYQVQVKAHNDEGASDWSASGTGDTGTPANNANLSALSVNGMSVAGFDPVVTAYQFGVASSVARATVAGVAADPDATVAYSGADADADGVTEGHQVDLVEGRNEVTVTVTAADGVTTKDYTVSVNRGSDALYGWGAAEDIDTLVVAGNDSPVDLWSNGETIWVVDDDDDKLYAYVLADGARDSAKDFYLTAANSEPVGIWSDGTTMWVADFFDDKLYAYALATGVRDSSWDLDTLAAAGNTNLAGIWSDGTTIWVADYIDYKLYAYTLATGARDPDKDIDTLAAALNHNPRGIWSDGTTIWVADIVDYKLYAYALSTGARDANWDFDTLAAAGNDGLEGIWSDGTTMWVVDEFDDKLYSYNMPGNANLSALRVDGASVAGFDHVVTTYQFGVASSVTRVTVAGVAVDSDATVAYSGGDADGGTDGHQVDLVEGRNMVTVTATAEDGVTTRDYTISVNRGSDAPYGWEAAEDIDTLVGAGNESPRGTWSDGTTIWVADFDDDKLYAYALADGARDSAKDFNLAAGNDSPYGIWSDGTTMWVADHDAKIYAYVLASGARDSGSDISVFARSFGEIYIWSDGTTMWEVNYQHFKLYAYVLATGVRDASKDFDLAAENDYPEGIWSNGTTMWVADDTDNKLYAYTLASGAREPGRDFDTLAGTGNTTPMGLWSDGTTMWVADGDDDKVYSYNMPVNNAQRGGEHGGVQQRGVCGDGHRRRQRHAELHAGGHRRGLLLDSGDLGAAPDPGGAGLRVQVVLLGDGERGRRQRGDGHHRGDDHGHGRGRAAVRAGSADGGGDGQHDDEPGRELDGPRQHRQAGDQRLRRAVPGGHHRVVERLAPYRDGGHGDDHGAHPQHLVPGAGEGEERRGGERLVRHGRTRQHRQRGGLR